MKNNEVNAIFSDVMNGIMMDRPENPVAYIIAFFEENYPVQMRLPAYFQEDTKSKRQR